MDTVLSDAFEQLLVQECTPQQVRRIEAGESAAALWQQLQESGFADALVPAERGGAGLTLADCTGLIFACGRHALPLPLPQTLLVRALMAEGGGAAPPGPITIADHAQIEASGAIVAPAVPCGRTAEWVLIGGTDRGWLLPTAAAEMQPCGGHGCLDADMRWSARSAAIDMAHRTDLRAACAATTAAQIAGAMERIAEMTIAYANARVQFGKPIGKLQAIQQQISVLTEQLFAARSAALLGLTGTGWQVDPLRAAVAKARASEAAVSVAAISHAVHGAMGITEEYDLQLFTRRLYDGRRHYGSESYWQAQLGRALLADSAAAPLDFVRSRLAAFPACLEETQEKS